MHKIKADYKQRARYTYGLVAYYLHFISQERIRKKSYPTH